MSEARPPRSGSRRMPKGSTFYEKLVPICLLAFGLITLALILVAAGVLFGVITWR